MQEMCFFATKSSMKIRMKRKLAVVLLIWVFLKMNNPSFQTILLSSIVVGFIGYLAGDYTKSIWFDTKTIMDLVDAVVSWGIIGAWLGWWLRRD